jgi:hypothetical protein
MLMIFLESALAAEGGGSNSQPGARGSGLSQDVFIDRRAQYEMESALVSDDDEDEQDE